MLNRILSNRIIPNVLTQDEVDQLKGSVANSLNNFFVPGYGQSVTNFAMPKNILDKFIYYATSITGISGLEIEYQFARYQLSKDAHGNIVNPKLTPHYDDRFSSPRFTIDYQIESNTSWPLEVEGKSFSLKDNQALTFSGTNQIHWRPIKQFLPGEYVDMLFCHFYPKDSNISDILKSDRDMNSLKKYFLDIYKNEDMASNYRSNMIE